MPDVSTFPLTRREIAGIPVAQLAKEFGTPVYIYDAASKKLKLDTHTPGKPQYTLASNCTNATFTYDIVSGQVMRVSVTIIVQVDKNTIRLTGSAAPRKVQTWQ